MHIDRDRAEQYALAAAASAGQAKESTTDPALVKLAEAVEYLGYALAGLSPK